MASANITLRVNVEFSCAFCNTMMQLKGTLCEYHRPVDRIVIGVDPATSSTSVVDKRPCYTCKLTPWACPKHYSGKTVSVGTSMIEQVKIMMERAAQAQITTEPSWLRNPAKPEVTYEDVVAASRYSYQPHPRQYGKRAVDHEVDAFRYMLMTGRYPREPVARMDLWTQLYGSAPVVPFHDGGYHNPGPSAVCAQDYAAADIDRTLNHYAKLPTVTEQGEPMNRLEVIEAELKRLQRERAILARFPKDNFDDDTVIKFEKVFGSWEDTLDSDTLIKYKYVASKAAGLWYLSGPKMGSRGLTWAELTEWMGDGVDKVYIMNKGELIVGSSEDDEAGKQVGLSHDGEEEVDMTPDESIATKTL